MKRDIKFKAKDIVTGKWVYGCYVNKGLTHVIIKSVPEPKGDHIVEHLIEHVVYPETVCQFSGFHDKNNVEIYEDDIVRFKENMLDEEGIRIYECKVVYRRCAFEVKQNDMSFIILGFFEKRELEVIGNIHDK